MPLSMLGSEGPTSTIHFFTLDVFENDAIVSREGISRVMGRELAVFINWNIGKLFKGTSGFWGAVWHFF